MKEQVDWSLGNAMEISSEITLWEVLHRWRIRIDPEGRFHHPLIYTRWLSMIRSLLRVEWHTQGVTVTVRRDGL
jgi:hypothetical protein